MQGQFLNKPYSWFIENSGPKLPSWAIKILGGCVLCTATWMGIIEMAGAWIYLSRPEPHATRIILVACYNAVMTSVLFNFMRMR